MQARRLEVYQPGSRFQDLRAIERPRRMTALLTTHAGTATVWLATYKRRLLIVSSQHALPDTDTASAWETSASFTANGDAVRFDPALFWWSSDALDVSLVAVDGASERGLRASGLAADAYDLSQHVAEAHLVPGLALHIYQHPGGRRIHRSGGTLFDREEYDIQYNCSTNPGSSGGLIVDLHGSLVGVHKAGSDGGNSGTSVAGLMRLVDPAAFPAPAMPAQAAAYPLVREPLPTAVRNEELSLTSPVVLSGMSVASVGLCTVASSFNVAGHALVAATAGPALASGVLVASPALLAVAVGAWIVIGGHYLVKRIINN